MKLPCLSWNHDFCSYVLAPCFIFYLFIIPLAYCSFYFYSLYSDPIQCYSLLLPYLACFQRFQDFQTRNRDRDRFLAGYTFGDIYCAVVGNRSLENSI